MSAYLALAALAQSAFSFVIYHDPMDDGATYIAMVGEAAGANLSVQCGALTNGKMAVSIQPGRRLYRADFPGLATYSDRARFDQRPAITVGLHYQGREAFAIDRDAAEFIAEIEKSERVTIEMTDARNETFTASFPLAGAADSIARVKAACSAKR